jgi:type II secretory pathway pseudopilin PulG
VSRKNKKYGGFLLPELAISVSLLGVLLTLLAISLNSFRRFNHYQLVRQRCVSAAQAQLDSIAVTGKAIDEEDFKRLWPKLSVSIQKSAGSGQWEGLKLIQVKAKAKSFNRDVKVELSRYILGEKRR